jgi:hypothetical protein
MLVHGEPIAEVNIVTVGAEILAVKRPDEDGSPLHLRKNLSVRENH